LPYVQVAQGFIRTYYYTFTRTVAYSLSFLQILTIQEESEQNYVRHCYTSSLSAQVDASFGLGAKHLKQEEVRRADVEHLGALKTSTLVQATPGRKCIDRETVGNVVVFECSNVDGSECNENGIIRVRHEKFGALISEVD
jgi:hypothetical protein